MAFIRETIKNKILDSALQVVEPDLDEKEYIAPWHIVYLEVDSFEGPITPKQLKRLGKWLVSEGKRIKKAYNSDGSKREAYVNIPDFPIAD